MTALLYYSISAKLTSEERIIIDREVASTYVFIKELPSNSKRKVKKLYLYGMFLLHLSQPLAPVIVGAGSMIITPLPPVLHRIQETSNTSKIKNNQNGFKFATILESKIDKIKLTVDQFNHIAPQIFSGSITLKEAVLELRAGDGLSDMFVVVAFVIFINWYDSFFGIEAFSPSLLPHYDPVGWLGGKYYSNPHRPSSNSHLEMEKPTSMPQDTYSNMPKAEKRKLADPNGRDASVSVENKPTVIFRYNQVKYKTPKHGADFGLVRNKEGKVEKSEKNAIAYRDSMVNMANRKDKAIEWYNDGEYQSGTPDECKTVNIYDKETQIIIVFEKQKDGTNLYLTSCKCSEIEVEHLIETEGKFVTEKILFKQGWISKTRRPSEIATSSPVAENSSSGFTQINTFESDVTGQTPINPIDSTDN